MRTRTEYGIRYPSGRVITWGPDRASADNYVKGQGDTHGEPLRVVERIILTGDWDDGDH